MRRFLMIAAVFSKQIIQVIRHRLLVQIEVVLACAKHFGASGLLGFAAEYYGDVADSLSLDGRIGLERFNLSAEIAVDREGGS